MGSHLHCKGVVKMGQSASRAIPRKDAEIGVPNLSIFPTNLGWFGLLGRDAPLVSVWVGHASADEVRRAARRQIAESGSKAEFVEGDWYPELRQRLERYCMGERCDFDDISLAPSRATEFQKRVVKIVRRIPYGKTLSYGRLAEKAGFPRAARAVGTVMSSNRFPIVVPCHRVVVAGGKTGGYTSPQGISLKLRLLAMEGAAEHCR
jgi:methylated-DNA-[protein]-cysteine S-methyltransferase